MSHILRINGAAATFNTVDAIKVLRSVTNLSLRDAKDFICNCRYLLVSDNVYTALVEHPDYTNHFMLACIMSDDNGPVGVIDSKSIQLPFGQHSISLTPEHQDMLSRLAGGLQTIADEIDASEELRNTKNLAYLLLNMAEFLLSYHGLAKRVPIQRWTFD